MTASRAASTASLSLFHGNEQKITVGRLAGFRQSAGGFQPENRSKRRRAIRRCRLSVRLMSLGEPTAARQSSMKAGRVSNRWPRRRCAGLSRPDACRCAGRSQCRAHAPPVHSSCPSAQPDVRAARACQWWPLESALRYAACRAARPARNAPTAIAVIQAPAEYQARSR